MSDSRVKRNAMGSKVAAVFGLLLLSGPAFAQAPDQWEHIGDATSLQGQVHVSSSRYACELNANRQTDLWTAPYDLLITRVWIWIGTDAGQPGQPYPQVDAYADLYVNRPMGYRIGFTALDRYAAPNGMHDKEIPRAHPLKAGDVMRGGFHCASVWNQPSHIQVLMTVEYTRVLP